MVRSFSNSPLGKIIAFAGVASAVAVTGSVDGKSYDYIIVGGGLSGLVAANRLSENSKGKFVAYPHISPHTKIGLQFLSLSSSMALSTGATRLRCLSMPRRPTRPACSTSRRPRSHSSRTPPFPLWRARLLEAARLSTAWSAAELPQPITMLGSSSATRAGAGTGYSPTSRRSVWRQGSRR